MGESDAQLVAESLEAPESFGEIFDRHAQTVHRYLARRTGPDEADGMLGDVFLAAFESRNRFAMDRDSALPWLYGIASNVLRHHFRHESVRRAALPELSQREATVTEDHGPVVVAAIDTSEQLRHAAEVIDQLPDGERIPLLLFAWEDLGYEEIAAALDVPVGTVRSRLNRARRRLREAVDEFDVVRELRPDRSRPIPLASPAVLTREKERLMQAIDWNRPGAEDIYRAPDVQARLAYRDEQAALEYLVRVFGFDEVRDARTDIGGHILAFLRMGNGNLMIGRADSDVHRIHSPADLGGSTVQMQVRVPDIDAHYERAVAEGADITMPLEDVFYGERRYEASDLEGHRWHFAEPFTDIRARGGDAPGFAPETPSP